MLLVCAYDDVYEITSECRMLAMGKLQHYNFGATLQSMQRPHHHLLGVCVCVCCIFDLLTLKSFLKTFKTDGNGEMY